ncbi:unnamed protein product [Musa acuminata subsp. malaccensis]|uniref:(wild Malaysian banana) hypothetical protein n=2 Tax=Musa acuminata TaxID=4641 RepID=A0A804L6V5_MUSAM|nr:unnamed protein product [Musa acuminata subsp. malaccensis]
MLRSDCVVMVYRRVRLRWRVNASTWGWPQSRPSSSPSARSSCPTPPNPLIERGYEEEAKAMLRKLRGTDDIQAEYDDLVVASEEAKSAPVLFKTIGFGDDASHVSAVINGVVNVSVTFVSIATVYKLGRRALFLQDGMQMLVSQVVLGTLIALKFGTSGVAAELTQSYASILVFFISVYVAAFAWSWSPQGWPVPTEIFPLEIRSAGQSTTVPVNMLFTFLIAQVFLTALGSAPSSWASSFSWPAGWWS